MGDRCFYFGCWNKAGHYLFTPEGRSGPRELELHTNRTRHLDGTLAPRRMRDTGAICWEGMQARDPCRQSIEYQSNECPQGQFLLHILDTGFTAIQWWDRCQGDSRGACNSTILLEGRHTAEEMLAALREHFPHVLENLTKAGIVLREIKAP